MPKGADTQKLNHKSETCGPWILESSKLKDEALERSHADETKAQTAEVIETFCV